MACHTCNIDRLRGQSRARRGFSIAEALTASVVLAIAVIGVAGPLTAASEQAAISQENATAVVLAKELIEEIAAKPLMDGGGGSSHLGPEAGSGETSRATFDSADDYHAYTDSSASLTNVAGNRVAVPSGFRRSVNVEYRTTPSGAAAATGNYAIITVTVTTPHGQKLAIARMMTKSRVTSTS